jgi:hypothetical protein
MANPETQTASGPTGQPGNLKLWLRVVFSILIIAHVLAVFTPPFAFSTRMGGNAPSPIAAGLMSMFRPYVGFMFLDHGYAFFAPDPGPSHLVRAHLEFEDGRPGKDVIYPDLNEQFPRLLYHRHFMLSESLNTRFVPPNPPPGVVDDSMEYRAWRHSRDNYEALWNSFERHIAKTYGATSAVLTRVEHRQLIPEQFQQGKMRINDASLYVDLPETVRPANLGGRP